MVPTSVIAKFDPAVLAGPAVLTDAQARFAGAVGTAVKIASLWKKKKIETGKGD